MVKRLGDGQPAAAFRWAVAISRIHESLELELGQAICRCLQASGCQAQLVQDGEAAGMDAEVLLLLISPTCFPAYCHQLRQAGGRRPRVILWQMDPLPPTDLSRRAEAIGLAACRWRRRFALNQSTAGMPRWQKLATLIRLREWLCKVVSGSGFRSAWRLMQKEAPGPLEVDWPQVRGVMQSWRCILDARHEGWLDHLAASTLQRVRFLEGRGIAAAFIPVGACEEFGCELGLERDIEVLFLGRIKHGRRADLLGRLQGALREQGISLHQVVDDCYGAARTRLLNRSRVMLNLHNFPWSPAWIRFLMAARCGTAVVSEPTDDTQPFVAGVHYVAAPAEELAAAAARLLRDEAARAQVVAASRDLCKERLTLARSVESLRKLISAAGV